MNQIRLNIIVRKDATKMFKKKYLMLLLLPLTILTSCGGNYINEGNYKVTSIDKEISGVITKDMKMKYYKNTNTFYSKIELLQDFEKLDSLKGYMIDMYYTVYDDGTVSSNANNIGVYKFSNCGLENYPVIKYEYSVPEIIAEPIKELYESKHYTKGYLCRYSASENENKGKKLHFTFYLIDFEYDENGKLKGGLERTTDYKLEYVNYNITDEIKVTFEMES